MTSTNRTRTAVATGTATTSGTTRTSAPPRARSPWRTVGIPTEHGGWGLTAEPALLGLALRPSVAGALLALAALIAFLVRTPLKVILVDRYRGRARDRTRRAALLVAAEGVVLVLLLVGAVVRADATFWVPAAIAAPLVGLELWFDMRSRSRRLVPELAGAVGVTSIVAMIVLAGGGSPSLAAASWLVLAARSITSITHVRALVAQLHGRVQPTWLGWFADVSAIALLVIAALVDRAVLVGTVAVAGVIAGQRIGDRHPTSAVIIGARQSILGLLVVVATAVGVHLT